MIERERPDVAILDVGLPGMDGFEVARRIRAHWRDGELLLIALTGYGQSTDRQVSRDAGFDLHLVKPVDVDHLLEVLGSKPDRTVQNG